MTKAKISDPWNHHDWASGEYVNQWAEGQDSREEARQEAFAVIAQTLPYGKDEKIIILDLGAGYGALSQFLLKEPLNNYCIREGFGFARLFSLGVIVLRCHIAMVLAPVVNFGP